MPAPSITSATTAPAETQPLAPDKPPRKRLSRKSPPEASDTPNQALAGTESSTPATHSLNEAPPGEPRFLSDSEQQQVLEWLHKGAAPAAACQQLGLTVDQFWETLVHHEPFAAALQRLFDTLSQNVLSALYQSAMKGNSSAQQFWLRQRPPQDWPRPLENSDESDPLKRLTDDQLADECRTAGVDLPPEIAARMPTPAGEA